MRLLGSGRGPSIGAGGYAIVGAAAFSVSVTGKLSIGVVISELTGQLSYSIPVLFACVVGLGAGQLVEIDTFAPAPAQSHDSPGALRSAETGP